MPRAGVPRLDRGTLLVAGFAAGLGCLVYWLAHAGLSDDSFIMLDYSRNLAMNGHWGLTGGLQSNTATSPLQVLLLTVVMLGSRLVTGGPWPIGSLGVFTVATMVATALWCLRIVRDLRLPTITAVLATGLVILEPLVLSSIGLETSLLVALLFGLLSEAVRGRPLAFGVLAGLAVLARLDMVVFVVIIGLGHAAVRRGWWRALGALLVIVLPWFVFSWLVLGSAIPVTLAIKQFQDYPGGWTFAAGFVLFLINDPVPTIIALLPAFAGLCWSAYWLWASLRRRFAQQVPGEKPAAGRLRPVAVFAAAGVLYFCVYSLLGVPPYVWYYAPTVVALTTFFAFATGALWHSSGTGRRAGAAVLGGCLLLASLGMDLDNGLPWRAPPIFGNYAMPADYARVGSDMRALVGDAAVESPGELGALAFYCHCEIVDQFSDPGRALPFIERQLQSASGIRRVALEFNYRNLPRDTPPAPATYHLVWEPGWVQEQPGVWDVYSPASLRGHLTLYPIS